MDNSTPNMSEKLVQYLDGALSEAEKNTVEHQLASDSLLKQEYENLLLVKESVRQYGLKEKVSGIHELMMEELSAPVKKINPAKKFIRYSISVAAGILLLAIGYIGYNFFTLTSEKVFSSGYQSFTLSTLRDGASSESAIEKAYREKNYPLVLQLHDSNYIKNQKNEFLSGMAALELKDNSKAITYFNNVISINKQETPAVLSDESEYYLALAYLRNEDYDLALEMMKTIRNNPNQLYRNKITNMLIQQVKMLKWR
jgi:tetratricopeptide (TPR) repeat protein